MKKLIDKKRVAYLESLENFRGYSDLTIKSYDESIKEAFKYVEFIEDELGMIVDLMPYRIKIAHLNAKTISKKLSAIRGFVEYLNDYGFNCILKSDDSVKVAKHFQNLSLMNTSLKRLMG